MAKTTKTIGTLMPSRTPAHNPNEDFDMQTESIQDLDLFADLTPKRMKFILRQARQHGRIDRLHRVYERMESTDTRFGGLVDKVEKKVAGQKIKVIEAEGTTEGEKDLAADYREVIEEMKQNLDMHTLVKAFTTPFVRGASVYQLRWDLKDYPFGRKIWLPEEVRPVRGHNLLMDTKEDSDTEGELLVRTKDERTGKPVREMDWSDHIMLESTSGHGRYDQIGVARKCLPWYLAMVFVQKWWTQFIESYGAPFRIGKFPSGASNDAKLNLKKFLSIMGQNGYGIFPSEMEIQLMEANKDGTVTTYRDFLNKGHEEYNIAFFGEAASTGDRSGGSFASDKAMVGEAKDAINDAAMIVSKGLQKLAEKTIRANYGDDYNPRLVPKLQILIQKAGDPTEKANTAKIAAENGVPVPMDYWYEQILEADAPREGEKAVVFGQEFEVGGQKPEKMASAPTENAPQRNPKPSDTEDPDEGA